MWRIDDMAGVFILVAYIIMVTVAVYYTRALALEDNYRGNVIRRVRRFLGLSIIIAVLFVVAEILRIL